MNLKWTTLCAIALSLSHVFGVDTAVVDRLKYGRAWDYQTILVNGQEVFTSRNTSGGNQTIYDRYEAIRSVLERYDRPFTVLDLGANNGFFSLKIAEEFDAVCVMVDSTDRLADICALNTDRKNIIYLEKNFNKEDIKELARREHFDVVLALHVLQHVDNWKSWVNTLFQLGDNVIIETPSVNDNINKKERTKALACHLTSLPQGSAIGSFTRGEGTFDHMLWFCQDLEGFTKTGTRLGIHPTTFFDLYGRFPERSYVQKIQETINSDQWILQGLNWGVSSIDDIPFLP